MLGPKDPNLGVPGSDKKLKQSVLRHISPRPLDHNLVGTFLGPAPHDWKRSCRCRGLSGMFMATRQATPKPPKKWEEDKQKKTKNILMGEFNLQYLRGYCQAPTVIRYPTKKNVQHFRVKGRLQKNTCEKIGNSERYRKLGKILVRPTKKCLKIDPMMR